MQNHRHAADLLPRPDGAVRKPHGARLRHGGGAGVHCQRLAAPGRALSQRMGEYVALRYDVGPRRRGLLRRLDEKQKIRHDLLQRRVPPGEFSHRGA